MTQTAAYDELAEWYETTFLAPPDDGAEPSDNLGIVAALLELLGPGDGTCLEIGCGTGAYATTIRQLGRTPIGVDISAGMLTYALPRLPVALGDAQNLPIADHSLSAVVSIMIHSDLPDYPAVLRHAARVLRPGGVFVHVGLHPCYCGAFANRGHPEGVLIQSGYREAGVRSTKSWTDEGIRSKIGAYHLPLSDLVNAFPAAGLEIDRTRESGGQTPAILAIRATRTARP